MSSGLTRDRLAGSFLLVVLAAGCVGTPNEPVSISQLAAEAYATRHPFPRLVVEIDHAIGREPSALALEGLATRLREVTDKDEIVILPPTPLPDEERFRDPEMNWADRTRELHAEFFDSMDYEPGRFGIGDTAYIHVLYLNGVLRSESGGAVGLHTERGIAMLVDPYRENMTSRLLRGIVLEADAEQIERAILVHEFGHAMGLVDGGAPMVRPHSDGGSHSSNPESVMRVIETTTALTQLGAEVSWAFDEDDLADLRALQEAAARRYAR